MSTSATDLTLSVPAKFSAFCRDRNLTPAQVLSAFMADLAETEDSQGSDERRLADDWFSRVVWPETEPRTYKITARGEAAGGGWTLTLFAGNQEAGGGVFPVTLNPSPADAMTWWQDELDESGRQHWQARAGETAHTEAHVVRIYRAYLVELAREDLEDEGEDWVQRGRLAGE